MGDFYQNGLVTTLHNFRTRSVESIEYDLEKFSHQRPLALVLPSLYSELHGPALNKILDEIVKVPYLDEVIIGLDRANKEEFKHAKKYFARLPQRHRILWNDGPGIQKLNKILLDRKLAPAELGKGRNAWFCFGYAIASNRSEAIALHDCDILTYSREMLARLVYPVMEPGFNYRFCKGYYYRSDGNKLQGRVARLMVTPLLRALKKMYGQLNYLEYLDSFRYPLAGEFSMRSDVVKTIRIPSDWGLEIGILSEVHRNNSTNRICQVDIADRYDHKHQPLSPDNPNAGLSKMSFDIAKQIFGKLAANGISFSPGDFRSIKATYYRIALDIVEQYHSDAVINGFYHDRNAEEEGVDLFAKNVYDAGLHFLETPNQIPLMPSWKRIMSADPEFLPKLHEIVEDDNQS
ncbi:MAG: hypothetical protein K9I94_04360 [Bacteroidales bacterium]|nr:hypothetical protein [Bacteroidales bacterium]